jgi:hypothetical protein
MDNWLVRSRGMFEQLEVQQNIAKYKWKNAAANAKDTTKKRT